MFKKVRNAVPWAFIISDPKDEEFVGAFYKKIIAKNESKRV